jgi:hypothetical protein
MTVSDKSSDKLVASIRKTKSAAATGSKKPAAKKAVKKRAVPTKAATGVKSTVKQSSDTYQSQGRVWPD